jgi:hypothetical protein
MLDVGRRAGDELPPEVDVGRMEAPVMVGVFLSSAASLSNRPYRSTRYVRLRMDGVYSLVPSRGEILGEVRVVGPIASWGPTSSLYACSRSVLRTSSGNSSPF